MNIKNKNITSKTTSACLLALAASSAFSGAMGPESTAAPIQIYIGVFGGAGSVNNSELNQSGTAFFTEAEGGPLAVNAFGRSGNSSMGIIGGHIGFAWPNAGLSFPVTPAAELEGYYMGGAKLTGHDLNNDTARLPEHDFEVSYPLKTGVFLVNAILNSSASVFGTFKPYVGVGIGSAVVSVSGATSLQVSPLEVGVNHYNANTADRAIAFAAQPKVGVHFDLSSSTSVFAEYRFLYISETNYTFGSTVTPTHAPTSPWLVRIEPQYYNMGTIGIDFDL